jgi:dynein heavy chain, axonemal
MRAVKAVLTAAAQLKRRQPTEREDVLILRAINDINLPKFLTQDVMLFTGIINDLFPGVKLPPSENKNFMESMAAVIAK